MIKILYIAPAYGLENFGYAVPLMGRHQKMHMIRHQYIGMNVATISLRCLIQAILEKNIILICGKDDAAIITSLDHMLRLTWK